MRAALAGALALALFSAAVAAEVQVPPLASRVTDLTGTLNSQQRSALEDKLEQLERSKGSQIAVLMLPSTEPETIEQYGIRVGETWKLGRKGVDDGAIVIVAKQDRAMRIEVGYGLEGALNDAICKRIISETITPFFKRGDFYEGIDAGIDQMIAVVNGEPLPEPKARANGSGGSGNWQGMIGLLFFAVFFVAPILRLIFGRTLGGIFTGGLAAFVAYLFTGVLVVAIIAGALGLFLALTMGFAPRRWSSGGVGWGGFPGGFGTGGGGGGFGGGGGGFGGGGASGRW